MTADAPPTPHRPVTGVPVRWPDDFGRRFAIFVDVEEEFDWNAPFPDRAPSVEAIRALPAAQARFRDRGASVTYMADYPVATDARAIDILREIAATPGTAIGTQLHPWVNPPHEEARSAFTSFAGNLPRTLEAAKLDRLTEAITAAFGAAPRVYRAGRYGIGPDTFALLAERGYVLDTSMRARHDYRAQGGPDFRDIGNAAFRTGPEGAIVELPLSTVFTGRLRGAGPAIHPALGRIPYGRGALARSGLLSRVPLTPEGTPLGEAIEAIRVEIGERARVLNFAFHSPSLVPGNTPYVRDAADLAEFHAWWDGVLDTLDRLDVSAASLDDLIAASR